MRHPFRHLAAVAAVATTLAIGATRGRADVVPEDHRTKPCTAPGQPCDYAAGVGRELEGDQPGTCVVATCAKKLPTRDGGTATVKFDCLQCVATGAGTATSTPKSKSSGCTVAPAPGDTGSFDVTVALIGGLVLVFGRRRTNTAR